MKSRLLIKTKTRVGLLADISYLLSKARINIEDINFNSVGTTTVIDLSLGGNEKKAIKVLEINGYKPISAKKNIFIALKDEPGALFAISKKLEDNSIKIKRIDVLAKGSDRVVISLCVDKEKKATKLLNDIIV